MFWCKTRHLGIVYYLLKELRISPTELVDLYGDNDQATRLGQEPMMTVSNKYYLPQYYYTREVHGVTINCERVDTAENQSDLLTKAVDGPSLRKLLPRITGHVGTFGTLNLFDHTDPSYNPL